jgi:hypothetical protein
MDANRWIYLVLLVAALVGWKMLVRKLFRKDKDFEGG